MARELCCSTRRHIHPGRRQRCRRRLFERPTPFAPLPCREQATAVDVKLEDQQKINQFSRLNTRLHELEAQLAAKRVRWGGRREGGR